MKKRFFGLDLIRVIAVIMVIAIHSLLKNGYYDIPLTLNSGAIVFLLTMLRWLLFTCVPIFIIITGYLKKDKKADKEHYKSIVHILIDYLIICFILVLYQHFYEKIDVFSIDTIMNIISFNFLPYSWYMQLYISLFLIIPFLNIMYNKAPNKKTKEIMILTIVLLCGLPTLINPLIRTTFNVEGNLLFYEHIPMTYTIGLYLIGAYIKEYQINIPKLKNIIYIIALVFLQTVITYYYCAGEKFLWGIMGDYGNLITIVLSALIFCLFYNINISKKHKKISKVMEYLSEISFSIYLISSFVDKHFYNYFRYLFMPWYKIIILIPVQIILHFIICVMIVSFIKLTKHFIKRIFRGIIKI